MTAPSTPARATRRESTSRNNFHSPHLLKDIASSTQFDFPAHWHKRCVFRAPKLKLHVFSFNYVARGENMNYAASCRYHNLVVLVLIGVCSFVAHGASATFTVSNLN